MFICLPQVGLFGYDFNASFLFTAQTKFRNYMTIVFFKQPRAIYVDNSSYLLKFSIDQYIYKLNFVVIMALDW